MLLRSADLIDQVLAGRVVPPIDRVGWSGMGPSCPTDAPQERVYEWSSSRVTGIVGTLGFNKARRKKPRQRGGLAGRLRFRPASPLRVPKRACRRPPSPQMDDRDIGSKLRTKRRAEPFVSVSGAPQKAPRGGAGLCSCLHKMRACYARGWMSAADPQSQRRAARLVDGRG
jgi:hypothetical protein